MGMPNGWIRLRAATTATSSYTKPTGYIFLSQYEYGGENCDEGTLQIQHGTVTGLCVAGQDVYGEMSTSGVYSCHEDSDNVVWEFEHFNSTDCTGNSLKVYKYEYPKGCNVGDKIDSKYVFQAGCGTKTTSAPYNDIKTGGYLLGSAITDASCDAGDEFYYSWVKTNTCLKGLDDGQGSRKFTDCSGMAVTVSLYSDPDCAKEEYSSVTSFECDVTDDYFYYYYDDNMESEEVNDPGPANASGAATKDDDDEGIVDDDGMENYGGNETYYADDADDDATTDDDEGDDAADDTPIAGKATPKAQQKAAAKAVKAKKAKKATKPKSVRKLLDEYTMVHNDQNLRRLDETVQPAPSADDDDASNNDDLAIFRNFVFGKCMVDGKEATPSSVPLTPTPPPKPANKINTDN